MGRLKKLKDTFFDVAYTVDETFESERFLKLRLRVCHDEVSPNRTFFTKDTMEQANRTIQYIPILVHQLVDDEGKPCFGSHDTHVEEDKLNPGESRVIYDEQPIGFIPDNSVNNCTVETYNGLNYTFVDAFIWRDYANYAEDLIEDAEETKLSMEISIPSDKIAYNPKEKHWDISEYVYRAITFLNPKYGTGMRDALATTASFAHDSESIQEQLLVMMSELTEVLASYNKLASENTKKGGEGTLTKFEELLQKYNKTVEDITFEYAELDDTALELAFEDAFGETEETSGDATDSESNDESTSDEGETGAEEADEADETDEDEETDEEVEMETQEVDLDNAQAEADAEPTEFIKTLEYKLSHEDIRSALYALIKQYEELDNEWYFVSEVYDESFVMEGMYNGKLYGQKYTKDDSTDLVALEGERWELFAEYLTATEKASLDEMRANYALVSEKLAQYEEAELTAKKDAVFGDSAYDTIRETKEFTQLVNQAKDFSVDVLVEKADALLGKYNRANKQFTETPEKKKMGFMVSLQTRRAPESNPESFVAALAKKQK